MSDVKNLNTNIDELRVQLVDLQEAFQNLVFQKSMQQLEDLSQIKKTRKKIARVKTLIHDVESSLNS